jgi:hypothetical protein
MDLRFESHLVTSRYNGVAHLSSWGTVVTSRRSPEITTVVLAFLTNVLNNLVVWNEVPAISGLDTQCNGLDKLFLMIQVLLNRLRHDPRARAVHGRRKPVKLIEHCLTQTNGSSANSLS